MKVNENKLGMYAKDVIHKSLNALMFVLCIVCVGRLYADWIVTSQPSSYEEHWYIYDDTTYGYYGYRYLIGWYEDGCNYEFEKDGIHANISCLNADPKYLPETAIIKPEISVSHRGNTYVFKCPIYGAGRNRIEWDLWDGTMEGYQENYFRKYGQNQSIGGGSPGWGKDYPVKRVVIEDGIKYVSQRGFSQCECIQSIKLPKDLKRIEDQTFLGCSSLVDVDMPDTIIYIGREAFAGCTNITSITWPKDLQVIDDFALSGNAYYNGAGWNCKSCRIKSAILPYGVEHIGSGTFASCGQLEEVYIPDTCTNIGHEAFAGCSKLSSVRLPQGITSLSNGLFSGCVQLREIEIPDTVKVIGEDAFSWSGLEHLEIPDSVKVIGEDAFSYTKLAHLSMPDSVCEVGWRVCGMCTNLVDVTLSHSLTNISLGMFCGCERLESINLPDNVTHIGSDAFSGCIRLKSFTIPDGVTDIGQKAFYECNSLANIYFKGPPPNLGGYDDVFRGVKNGAVGWYLPEHKAAWEAVIDENGYWHGLKMRPDVAETYTITYVANNESGFVTNIVVAAGEQYTIADIGSLEISWEGHYFQSWALVEADGTTKNYRPGDPITVNSDFVFEADWCYALKFDANAKDATGTMVDMSVGYGDPVSLPVCAFEREGYFFVGWSTSSNVNAAAHFNTETMTFDYDAMGVYRPGDTWCIGDETSLPNGVTLYAVWAKNYTVKLRPNTRDNERDSPDEVTVSLGLGDVLPGNTFSSSYGFGTPNVFIGWTTLQYSNGKCYRYQDCSPWDGAGMRPGEEVSLYAIWTRPVEYHFYNSEHPVKTLEPKGLERLVKWRCKSWESPWYDRNVPDEGVNGSVYEWHDGSETVCLPPGDYDIEFAVENGGASWIDEEPLRNGDKVSIPIINGGYDDLDTEQDWKISRYVNLLREDDVMVKFGYTLVYSGEMKKRFDSSRVKITIRQSDEEDQWDWSDMSFEVKTGSVIPLRLNRLYMVEFNYEGNDGGWHGQGDVFRPRDLCPNKREVIGNFYSDWSDEPGSERFRIALILPSGASSSLEGTIGDKIYLPQLTDKGQRKFLGWYADLLLKWEKVDDGTQVTQAFLNKINNELYAKWDESIPEIVGGWLSRVSKTAGMAAVSVLLPSSVVGIQASAFVGCEDVEAVVFEGNAPEVESGAFDGLSPDCTAYVHRASTGWGVEIPGTWNGIKIAYIDDVPSHDPVTPDPVTPEPVTPDPVTPDPVTPEPDPEPAPGPSDIAVPDGYSTYNDGTYTWVWKAEDGGACLSGFFRSIDSDDSDNDEDEIEFLRGVYPEPTGTVTIPAMVNGLPVVAMDFCLFFNCNNVTEVVIPDSVTYVSSGAFYGCNGLTSIVASDGNPAYRSVSGLLLTKDGKSLVAVPQGLTSVAIPDGVTDILEMAFYKCVRLTSVTIPDSMMYIDTYAFYGCNDALFDTVTIPGAKLVDGWAVYDSDDKDYDEDHPPFSGDMDLTGIRGIGENAFFYFDGLTGVTIPSNITRVTSGAFIGDSEESSLNRVTIENPDIQIEGSAFLGCGELASFDIAKPGHTLVGWHLVCYMDREVYDEDTWEPTGEYEFMVGDTLDFGPSIDFMTKGCTVTNSSGKVFNDYGFSGFWVTPVWEKVENQEPVTPEPATPEPAPVTPDPVTPEPEPTVEEVTYGGAVENVTFSKARTVIGALYDAKGSLAGTVELKFGKINKKQVVKVSGSATLLVGGKAKKVTAKAANVTVDATERVPPTTIAFKAPVGDMAFAMDADGAFTLKNAKYEMVGMRTRGSADIPVVVGGAMPNGTLHFNVDMDSVPNFGKDGMLLESALPADAPVKVSGGKWSFDKAATLKYAKNKATGAYGLIGLNDAAKPNVSGLKLTYTAKTGIFKGSFKLYATNEATTPAGKAPKLKKYTVNVIGFVVDGVGYGEATLKKPAASWTVTVE